MVGQFQIPEPKAGWEDRVVRDLHLATPALVAGGQTGPAASAEARLTSLLGMLRFWWRATSSLPASGLRKREIELFGGPALKGSRQGTGCFTASLSEPAESKALDRRDFPADAKVRHSHRKLPQSDITAYLGPGVGQNRSAALPAGEPFGRLTLMFGRRAGAPDRREKVAEDRREVLRALEALCLFGGVGLLSRRGMGSLMACAPDQAPTFAELAAALRRFKEQLPLEGEPGPIPCFSKKASILLVPTAATSGVEALELQAQEAIKFAGSMKPAMDADKVFAGQVFANGGRLPSTLFVHVHLCSSEPSGAGNNSAALVLTNLPLAGLAVPAAAAADLRIGSYLDKITGRLSGAPMQRILWSGGA